MDDDFGEFDKKVAVVFYSDDIEEVFYAIFYTEQPDIVSLSDNFKYLYDIDNNFSFDPKFVMQSKVYIFNGNFNDIGVDDTLNYFNKLIKGE